MNSITLKGIRKQIEEEDSKDYSSEKEIFAEIIQECLENRLEKEPVDDDNFIIADEDADFRLATQLQQEEQDRSSSRTILRRRASGINRKYQEGVIIKPSKRKSDVNPVETDTVKPKTRTFHKPLILSAEMAALFNNDYPELTRPEVVKKIWEYIKAHDLQDPKDKRFILCDEKLMNVFNRPRMNCFKMAKFMTPHLYQKDDMAGVFVQSAKSDPKQPAQQIKTTSSPKKLKISNETVEDSDEEASEVLDEAYKKDMKMNPLLLNIPGVSAGMTFTAVQASVLAYIQSMKVRHQSDTDMIIVKPTSPISKLMGGRVNDGTVHVLDLIQRVHYLFDHKNAE